MDVDPATLKILCQLDWPTQSRSWPPEGSFEVTEILKVHRSVLGESGGAPHPDQFVYADQWLALCQQPPTWLLKCQNKCAQSTMPRPLVVAAVKTKNPKKKNETDLKKAEAGNSKREQMENLKKKKEAMEAGKKATQKKVPNKNPFILQDPEEYRMSMLPPPYNPVYPALPNQPTHQDGAMGGGGTLPPPAKDDEKVRMEREAKEAEYKKIEEEKLRLEEEVRRLQKEKEEALMEEEKSAGEVAGVRTGVVTRSMAKEVREFPLRTQTETTSVTVGGTPQVQTRTLLGYYPFSTIDLHNWKNQGASLSENPSPLIKLFQGIIRTHNPTYEDIDQLMDHLLTDDERDRVWEGMRKELRTRVNSQADFDRELPIQLPSASPSWDPNTRDGSMALKNFQTLFLAGLKRAGQKHIDMAKVSEIIQGPTETPGEFMRRLKEAYRQYTTVDPDAEANRRLVNQSFLQQCAKDIKKKIQKVEGHLDMDQRQMMEIARKVYSNRDDEEERGKKQAVIMAAAIRGEIGTGYERGRGRGQSRGRGRGRGQMGSGQGRGPGWQPLARDQCKICRNFGHWGSECPTRPQGIVQGPIQSAREMFQSEDQ